MDIERRYRIATEAQREAALDRIAELVNFKPGTPEHAELTILLIAVAAYEGRPRVTTGRMRDTVH